MTDRRKLRGLLKIWIALLAILVIIGYGTFRAKNLALGPSVEILSPQNGVTVDDPLIEVRGTAKNISFLSLNGNKIFTDESGAYDEKILLATGYNIVTLKAEDRFGRSVVKQLQLISK
jgi:hypothetical protein